MSFIKRTIDYVWKLKDPIGYARKIGVTLGENCRLNGSPNWGSEPWLISLGNHTEISFDCVFITHDGATWVFRDVEKYRGVLKFGKITLGNDCFIGARSIIMPGVSIGDRSIVAAGAVVTKTIPTGEVWGGGPAKFITTVDEYAERCLRSAPEYDTEKFKTHKREEIIRFCEAQEKTQTY